jgi:hypothetical protein
MLAFHGKIHHKNSSYKETLREFLYPQENALKPTIELQLYGNQTLE